MRLRRSDPAKPGLRRVRRGRGFSYVDASGKPVDAETRARIQALVVPPAWQDVWICPYPNGHIQVVGTDDAGRKQYLYHADWSAAQDKAKHERVRTLARRLPVFRTAVDRDLRRPGLGRERVVAAALRMLDDGMFRPGGDVYEQENGSHGVSTLLREHVTVHGDTIDFCFPAKSGQQREASLTDPLLAKAVLSMKRSKAPGPHLLQFRDTRGWHDMHADDVNAAFKELAGEDYTVKDLRTWGATVTAAVALARAAACGEEQKPEVAEKEAIALVAEQLGNTPTVARGSYVNPTVIEHHAQGRTIEAAVKKLKRVDAAALAIVKERAAIERAVLRLLATKR